MRKLILFVVAAAIAAGVLANNPSASAPSLAASLAGIPSDPLVPTGAASHPDLTNVPTDSLTPSASTGSSPAVSRPEVGTVDAAALPAPTSVRVGASADPLGSRPGELPNATDEPLRLEENVGPAVATISEAPAASFSSRPFSDVPKLIARPVSSLDRKLPSVRYRPASVTKTFTAKASIPYQTSLGPVSMITAQRVTADLSPQRSAEQTLIRLDEPGLAWALPEHNFLELRLAEAAEVDRVRAERGEVVPETSRTVHEMIERSIAKTIKEPLPATPLIATARKPAVRKAGAKDVDPISNKKIAAGNAVPPAVVSPVFARADGRAPAPLNVVAKALPKVFTINIEDSSPASFNGSPIIMHSGMPDAPAAAAFKPAAFQLNLQDGGYCDSNFVGPTITFAQTAELTLDDFLYQIHNRFGVNFIMGASIGSKPVNIKAGSIPWNRLLRSMLFISGVRARCIDSNTIELIDNASLSSLQDSADVATRFVKLKFLQRTSGGTVDLANRSQGGQNGGQGGGCGGNSSQGSGTQSGGQSGGQSGETVGQQGNSKFDRLVVEIEKILGIRSMNEVSGQSGAAGGEVKRTNRFVTQIPGRNILAISATEEEHALIDQIIVRADRPPFQVVIKGLVYTANQDRLRDIGVQTSITEDSGRTRGGVFGHTLGAGTLFDFSTIIGTFDFNVQATALQQNGVISVKSRPFATVLDGLCTTLNVGRQIPIVIDSSLGGQGDVVFVDASNNLAVTPYVIDDENGDPMAVTLELRLGANDVDSSVTSRGVPAISQRSIQTQLLLGEDKTAILGGFTVDQDSRTVSKTPGLGDIPIIGELFKRRVRDTRINRLYFAISVSIIPYGEAITPVSVPGATTEPPSITPEMKQRGDKAEPKQVVAPINNGP